MLQPTRLISTPFAQEGEKTEIQNVTGEFDNSATYQLGFPPLTMQSIRLGGKPPKGTDFNGILFDITENISFLCKGGRYQYNAGLSTLIGGYPEGSNLLLDDNVTEVVSTVAGNQNNPNTDMTGWILKPNKTTAVNVADASGETQQQVNYNGGSKWHSRVGGYLKNERVVLANGDIVKSTIDGNTNNPNVDMTGWVNTKDASQVFDENGLNQQEINNSVKRTISNITALQSINSPKNGQSVEVLTYADNKDLQPLVYTYEAMTNKIANGGSYIAKGAGMWVARYSGVVDARWFGAKGDATTDDRDAIQRANIYIREMGGGELQLKKGTYLVNSYLTSHFYSWDACINLDSNMRLFVDHDASLKVGNFKDGQDLLVISCVGATPNVWDGTKNTEATAVDNVCIYGTGSIDLTGAGDMGQIQRSRAVVALCRNSNFKMFGLTVSGGDLSGVVANLRAKTYGIKNRVYDNKFNNLVANPTANTDHSTIYLNAEDSQVYNNYFYNDLAKGKLVSSACELHNSNSYFFNNTVIGYTNGLIVAIMQEEHYDLTVPRGNIFGFANTLNTVRGFCYFDLSEAFAKILPIKFYDNICKSQRYLTAAEHAQTWYDRQSSRHWFEFYTPNAQASIALSSAVEIYNNVIEEDTTNYNYADTDSFSVLIHVVSNQFPCANLIFRDNKVKVKRLFSATSIEPLKRIFYGWKFYNNIIDTSLFDSSKIQMDFSCLYMDNCVFDIKFHNWSTYAPTVPFLNIVQAYTDVGSSNTINIDIDNTQDIQQPFFCNPEFILPARANKVRYPCRAVMQIEPFNASSKTVSLVTTPTALFPYQMTNRVGLKRGYVYTISDTNVLAGSLFKVGADGYLGDVCFYNGTFPTANVSTTAIIYIEN